MSNVEHDEYRGVIDAVERGLPLERREQILEEAGLTLEDATEVALRASPSGRRALFAMASELDPREFDSVPRSSIEVQEAATQRAQEEWAVAQGIVQSSGPGGFWAEFMGRGGAGATDMTSLAMGPIGIGRGGIGRAMIGGALGGAAGEAAILPQMFDQADRLDLPDVRPGEQIAMGAVFGAALSGVGDAMFRGVQYARLRRQIARIPPDVDAATAQEAVATAIDALQADRPVPEFENPRPPEMDSPPPEFPGARDTRGERLTRRILRNPNDPELAPAQQAPAQQGGRSLTRISRALDDAEAAPAQGNASSAVDEAVGPRDPAPLDVQEQAAQDGLDPYADLDEINAQIASIREANPELDRRAPLIRAIIARGGIQSRRRNPGTGEMELTEAAAELYAQDVTPKRFPGLFNNRTGMADIDNIVLDELFDGNSRRLPEDGNGYVDRNSLIEAMVGEASGRPFFMNDATEAAARQIEELEGSMAAIADDLDSIFMGNVAPRDDDGPFFPIIRDGEDIGPRTDRAELVVREYDPELPPQVESIAAEILGEYGGSVESAVTRALIDHHREAYEHGRQSAARGAEALQGDGARAEAAGPNTAPAQANAGRDGLPGADGRTETTPEGEQFLAPGVDPISDIERLEAIMNVPLRGGDAAPDMGLFDEGARRQQDMFDEPWSPEATRAMNEHQRDIADGADEYGDIEVIDPDTGEALSVSRLLREMDADSDHLATLEACGVRSQ